MTYFKRHKIAIFVYMTLFSGINIANPNPNTHLFVFGDSLSDTGNVMRFTYNSAPIYNEYLADYYGYDFPSPNGGRPQIFSSLVTQRHSSLTGPNFAQGGAVANTDLGLAPGPGKLFKVHSDIQVWYFYDDYHLGKYSTMPIEQAKFVYWLGGNDLRLASPTINRKDPRNNDIIKKSIRDVETQLERLMSIDARFFIVPEAPNLAYTPNFLHNFIDNAKVVVDGKTYSLLSDRNGKKAYDRDTLIRYLDDRKHHKGESFRQVFENALENVVAYYNDGWLTEGAIKELNAWKQELSTALLAETELVRAYNDGVDQVITRLLEKRRNRSITILRPKIDRLFDDIISNYTAYGFNNVTGSATSSFSSGVLKNLGTGTRRAGAFEPEDGLMGEVGVEKTWLWTKGYKYVFSDPFHPSPKMHRLLYEYLVSLLESESGHPEDFSVVRRYTTLQKNTSNRLYHNAEGDGVLQAKNKETIVSRNGLSIFNDGRTLFSKDYGVINLSDFSINANTALGGAIVAEKGGKINLSDGVIHVERVNPYAAPFGIWLNGKSTMANLNKVRLSTNGKEATAITVGNKASLSISDSTIQTSGLGANALNLWDSSASIKQSTLLSHNGNGIRVFTNDYRYPNTYLKLDNSRIYGKENAIKIQENGTFNPVKFTADIVNNSTIEGRVTTSKNTYSQLNFVDSTWNVLGSSSVSSLNLTNSQVRLVSGAYIDNWTPKQLNITDTFYADTSGVSLGASLGGNNKIADQLILSNKISGITSVFIYPQYESTHHSVSQGLKVIDIQDDEHDFLDKHFELVNRVSDGINEYILANNVANADDPKDYYLTSIYTHSLGKPRALVLEQQTTLSETIELENEKSVKVEIQPKHTKEQLAEPSSEQNVSVENVTQSEAKNGIADSDNLKYDNVAMAHETLILNEASNGSNHKIQLIQNEAEGSEKNIVLNKSNISSLGSSNQDISDRIRTIYNPSATLFASLPYISSYLSEQGALYATEHKPKDTSSSQKLSSWATFNASSYNVAGEEFLELKQQNVILSLGHDFVSNPDNNIGVSSTFIKSNIRVNNKVSDLFSNHKSSGDIDSRYYGLNVYKYHKKNHLYTNFQVRAAYLNHIYKSDTAESINQSGSQLSSQGLIGLDYPLTSSLNVNIYTGLDLTRHNYQGVSTTQIQVDKISKSSLNWLNGVRFNYQYGKVNLSYQVDVNNNLRSFEEVVMNEVSVLDRFNKKILNQSLKLLYSWNDNVGSYVRLTNSNGLDNGPNFSRKSAEFGITMSF